MGVQLKCPCCNKRAMDVIEAKGNVVMEIKCPQCHKIVKIQYINNQN